MYCRGMRTPSPLTLALSAAITLFCSARGHAQSTTIAAPARASAQQTGRFSVGAGLGFYYDGGGVGGLSGLAGIGTLSSESAAVTPFGTALFEWAATRSLRLMVGASGSYAKQLRIKGEERSSAAMSRWSAGLGVGLRWVLNPGQVVEFSPALLLGVHGGKSLDALQSVAGSEPVFGQTEIQVDSSSFGADARLGFVLEHALLPQLSLRFECYLVRGGFDIHARRTDVAGRTRQGQAGLGWGLAPMLQLRLSL